MNFTHPFERIDPGHIRRYAVPLFLLDVAVGVPLLANVEAGPGLVSLAALAVAGSPEAAAAVLATWTSTDRIHVAFANALQRQMANLVAERTRCVQWMQKALDQMNVQVHRAVADLTGTTGLAIVRAIVAAARLAAHRDPRCHKSVAEIARYLTGPDGSRAKPRGVSLRRRLRLLAPPLPAHPHLRGQAQVDPERRVMVSVSS